MKGSENATRAASQAEFTKIQELLYELRIEQIMTHPVVSIPIGTRMTEVKESMRFHRFSGLPVADGDQLLGIVSVEDVIRWLEAGAPEASVEQWMTRKVHTLRVDEAAAQALSKFDRHKVGRLPVLDSHGKLAGIVTPGDIISRVLRVLDARYREYESGRPRTPFTMADLASDDTTLVLRFQVSPRDFDKAGTAATRIKRVLECFGTEPRLVRRAGIAAYEAEMNLVIHTDSGGTMMVELKPHRLCIESRDSGPGIPDVEQALTPGFSTAPDWIRELGFGAGMGLNNMRMCADGFSIQSEVGKGTLVRVVIHLDERKPG